MSLETCPFCGKAFKRLKSHLPHCKMSPESKEMLSTSLKHTSNKDKMAKVNIKKTDSESSFKSQKAEKAREDKDNKLFQNTAFTLTSTVSKVLPTEEMNVDRLKPPTKWLAKRHKEMFKQDKLRTQTINFTSVFRQDKYPNETFTTPVKDTHLLENEVVSGQKQPSHISTHKINCSASNPLQRVPQCTDWQDNQLIPMCKENTNASEQIPNIPNHLTKESTLRSRDEEQGVRVFQTKTCVWDHIQYGPNGMRYDRVSVLFPIISAHTVSLTVNSSESALEPHTGNGLNATVMASPEQFPTLQSSIHRPVLSSQFPSRSALPYSPDMATGYGGSFSSISSHSEISIKNPLLTCQTSKPSSLSQGSLTELRLGDVRLNRLVSWLFARTPKSPREAVLMLNTGWQWYYRKYIDVQKGGIGGIAMLIGSYCVLSYIWSYPHNKKDRWRKHH